MLTWLTLAFVFIFCSVTVALFVNQLRRSWTDTRGRQSEVASNKQALLVDVGKGKVRVRTIDTSDGEMGGSSAEKRAARRKLKVASASSSIQLAAIERRKDIVPSHDTTVDWATEEKSISEGLAKVEGKTEEVEVEMAALQGRVVQRVRSASTKATWVASRVTATMRMRCRLRARSRLRSAC